MLRMPHLYGEAILESRVLAGWVLIEKEEVAVTRILRHSSGGRLVRFPRSDREEEAPLRIHHFGIHHFALSSEELSGHGRL